MPSGRSEYLTDLDAAELWAVVEAAAEQVGIGVYVALIDAEPPRIVHITPRAAQMTGRTVDELVGALPWSMLSPADHSRIRELINNGGPIRVAVTVVRPDGSTLPVEVGAERIRTARGTLSFGYLRDLSAERDAVEALRRSEARFRFLVEAAPDGVVILVAGHIVFINPKAARLLGADDPAAALGRPIAGFLPPADAAATAERIATMFRTGQEVAANEYGVLADPSRVVEIKSIRCEWEGKAGVLAFARDVTARKALDKKLVEADRLTALGTLAAGVAHEINNPLTYTQLSLQRIERTLAAAGLADALLTTIREQLVDAHHGIARASAITSSLRTFARADDAPPGPVDVAGVIDRALEMVDNDLRHRARLVRRIADTPRAIGNASRLEQVIVNLLLNAIQSLPADATGCIEVTATSAGANVAIAITDNGRGIAPAIRDRVFDPFFTTKPVGEGMGLGLAVCKSIIDSFGGTIRLDDAPGSGTTATIELRTHAAPAIASVVEPARSSSRLRMLLIDDDDRLRTVLAKLLGDDHDVTEAAHGAAALVAIAETSFDAIICDVMMPELDGREVHRRIAASHPGLERRIVFITGGTFDAELDRFLGSVGNRCLTKPFPIDELLAAVAEAATK